MIQPFPPSPSSVNMDSPSNVSNLVSCGVSEGSSSSAKNGNAKRNSLLNKFLSKTYHMIDNCDEGIACWSKEGKAFTIVDQDRFQADVLPKYFNHGKFASFIRQLNFYGFVKLRSESDLQTHTQSIRFAHEFFQKGRPDLLHRITRSTAQKPETNVDESQMERMQRKIDKLQRKVESLEGEMDDKIRRVTVSLTEGYMSRISTLEASYERLLQAVIQMLPPMASSLSSGHLSPTGSAAAAVAASRTAAAAAAWHPNPGGSPINATFHSNMVSNFMRSKNQPHWEPERR